MDKFASATFFATLLLCGCKVVCVDGPLGKSIEPDSLHQFVGEWDQVIEGDGPAASRRHVRMTRNGRLRVAELKWSQNDQKHFVLDSEAMVTRIGKARFLNFAIPGSVEANAPKYLIARIQWEGKANLELYPANFDEFKRLFDRKDLNGQLVVDDHNKNMLFGSNDLAAWLTNNPERITTLFPEVDGKAPIVLNRVRTAQDSQKYYSPYLLDKNTR